MGHLIRCVQKPFIYFSLFIFNFPPSPLGRSVSLCIARINVAIYTACFQCHIPKVIHYIHSPLWLKHLSKTKLHWVVREIYLDYCFVHHPFNSFQNQSDISEFRSGKIRVGFNGKKLWICAVKWGHLTAQKEGRYNKQIIPHTTIAIGLKCFWFPHHQMALP